MQILFDKKLVKVSKNRLRRLEVFGNSLWIWDFLHEDSVSAQVFYPQTLQTIVCVAEQIGTKIDGLNNASKVMVGCDKANVQM